MFELMIAVEVKKNEARLAAMEVAQAAAPTQPAPIPLDGGSAGQR